VKLFSIISSSVSDSDDFSLAKSLCFQTIFFVLLLGVSIEAEVKLSL